MNAWFQRHRRHRATKGQIDMHFQLHSIVQTLIFIRNIQTFSFSTLSFDTWSYLFQVFFFHLLMTVQINTRKNACYLSKWVNTSRISITNENFVKCFPRTFLAIRQNNRQKTGSVLHSKLPMALFEIGRQVFSYVNLGIHFICFMWRVTPL